MVVVEQPYQYNQLQAYGMGVSPPSPINVTKFDLFVEQESKWNRLGQFPSQIAAKSFAEGYSKSFTDEVFSL